MTDPPVFNSLSSPPTAHAQAFEPATPQSEESEQSFPPTLGQPMESASLQEGEQSTSGAEWWPCGICQENCPDGAVECSGCLIWFHFTCVDVVEGSVGESEDWFCPTCDAAGTPSVSV